MTVIVPAASTSLYSAYSYSYPHKTAYRNFEPAVRLKDAWAGEKRDGLFLYFHIPFCEMRCGFCNLFTTTNPVEEMTAGYLAALKRQASQVKNELPDLGFARMAIGGGTPTFLNVEELEQLFDLACEFGADSRSVPVSIEVSPATCQLEKLAFLHDRRVNRVSIGVQSFEEAEARAAGRAQSTKEVHDTLSRIRQFAFPILNIDLIYGLPGQTEESWLKSLQTALTYRPEEIYLYPLYVRPMTGMAKHYAAGDVGATKNKDDDDSRLALYRAGRAFLLQHGYKQVSMRMFQAPHCPELKGPVYCCQTDGMIGLGCGARSYTRTLHYSGQYAVGGSQVKQIIAEYVAASDASFQCAERGFRLDEDEQRRRFVIQSLLQIEGLNLQDYFAQFHTDVFSDFPIIHRLIEEGFACTADVPVGTGTIGNAHAQPNPVRVVTAHSDHHRVRLTEAGMERSDKIGFDLYSPAVLGLMKEYQHQ